MVSGKGQLMESPLGTIWYYPKMQLMWMPHDPENAPSTDILQQDVCIYTWARNIVISSIGVSIHE